MALLLSKQKLSQPHEDTPNRYPKNILPNPCTMIEQSALPPPAAAQNTVHLICVSQLIWGSGFSSHTQFKKKKEEPMCQTVANI